ncbi:MAG: 3,4-dihydroxy-2-butanone-4-phosphate synthase [Methylobacterium sp.]|nr:3,4-dihydroxy-2-butanone-4-phosphate synthase [Methylobacterium sp.]MCA3657894.1 3,4-dihydroxy-2-butanone-4-phosphate synthase [Methylobacterium sp.]MCA3661299.1 3,4-dihydroxy-2-butanone-4-phosphate synthase [Methylobacterium sp.]MCA3662451.1 3,4-dihydroxy-2-butanone-4-phosphate synthase [Methylobacterium sp.]MCA3667759.1 3,4-dihydroxy-2-butanone-4-phosphate synthase [Methylobacterium sp.]
MKLENWLKRTGTRRSAFAQAVGLSPASITALCKGGTSWISRETAERIARATGGAVTPNDFLGLGPTERMNDMPEITNRVLAAIQAFKRGEIVVVTDDDDREGEGDLIVAASLCTPEKMAFIVRHTSGIVCTPLPIAEARRLRLDPMVAVNDSAHTTAFTVSIDYREGLTTGISADERTATVRALTNGNVQAGDFVRPGHIFPLIARDGGVLMRSGHTEAAVDLCRLAGLPPVGVISELVNDDGTVTKGQQVTDFATRHKLARLTIADLIAYRQAREKLVERVNTFPVETAIGTLTGHAFTTPFDEVQHLALVYGDIGDGKAVVTRLHRANAITDVFGGGKGIEAALHRFRKEGRGVLVYLRDGTAGVPKATLRPQNSDQQRAQAWREVGLGAQILRDLGVQSIRNLSTSGNRAFVGLNAFGIEIAGTETL